MTDSKSKVICKNNFKGEKDTTTKENFTKKWINIVNQLERNKNAH